MDLIDRSGVQEGGSPVVGDASRDSSRPQRHRFRIIFSKKGPIRFISHNDLLRTWDRLIRRTRLPLKFSEGFHSKPRLSSPLSLAVGLEADEEVLDIELTEFRPLETVRELLHSESVPGLDIVSVSCPTNEEASSRVTAIEYTCLFQEGLNESEVSSRMAELLSGSSWVVERRAPNKPLRRVDIRPKIDSIAVVGNELKMRLYVDGGSTVRPEEVLGALGLGQKVREGLVSITRSRLELSPKQQA